MRIIPGHSPKAGGAVIKKKSRISPGLIVRTKGLHGLTGPGISDTWHRPAVGPKGA